MINTWLLVMAMIGATSVPILYSFTKWNNSKLGRLFMWQSLSFAGLFHLMFIIRYANLPQEVIDVLTFWTYLMVLISTTGISISIWKLNYSKKDK